eukprot:TRINITY_DN47004_c0_g1_i1.p1 TRINITY_DN47004_c0_g1~~TRINITY_DN47004_c0_g1_i1.p1  ORF type:complete len:412 (+),score=106.95 TRINITY_DN47004_c0_g1_i1:95-1330(+)
MATMMPSMFFPDRAGSAQLLPRSAHAPPAARAATPGGASGASVGSIATDDVPCASELARRLRRPRRPVSYSPHWGSRGCLVSLLSESGRPMTQVGHRELPSLVVPLKTGRGARRPKAAAPAGWTPPDTTANATLMAAIAAAAHAPPGARRKKSESATGWRTAGTAPLPAGSEADEGPPEESHGDRHALLRELESYLSGELPLCSTEEATLRVYSEAFTRFIEGFEAYRGFLTGVRDAYQQRLARCDEYQQRIAVAAAEIALSDSREAANHAQFTQDVNTQRRMLIDRAKGLELNGAEAKAECEQWAQRCREAGERAASLQEQVCTLQRDRDRMASTLQHLNNMNEELKAKSKTVGEDLTALQADMEAKASGLAHDNGLLAAEVDDLEHRLQAMRESVGDKGTGRIASDLLY